MNMKRDCRPVGQGLALLFLLGFAVRLVVAHLLLGGLGRTFEGDESAYAGIALSIVDGLGFPNNRGVPTSIIGPGVPLLIAIPTAVFGPHITGIRIFMCLEALLVPACYLLARSLGGSRNLGLTAATIAIFFPTWLVPSGAIMTACRLRLSLRCWSRFWAKAFAGSRSCGWPDPVLSGASLY